MLGPSATPVPARLQRQRFSSMQERKNYQNGEKLISNKHNILLYIKLYSIQSEELVNSVYIEIVSRPSQYNGEYHITLAVVVIFIARQE